MMVNYEYELDHIDERSLSYETSGKFEVKEGCFYF